MKIKYAIDASKEIYNNRLKIILFYKLLIIDS